MKLKTLYLRNFRNIRESEVYFSDQLNVIQGDNAQGKTNLLEAIFLICTGRSFRTQKMQEIILEGESFFYLEALIEHNQLSRVIKLSYDGLKKRLQIDSNSYPSFSPLLGLLPIVLYTPSDLEFIGGAPQVRRRFLNLHLSQSDPLYVHHWLRYLRSMKQRNYLLKQRQLSEELSCWEEIMASCATYLHKSRQALVDDLKTSLAEHSSQLCQPPEIHELKFHPSFDDNYLKRLQNNRLKEKDLGFTLMGPHRDDLSFLIEKRASKLFASEGQKKTAILSLRFAEWERMKTKLQEAPLMAIDDLDLSLDAKRQQFLKNKLQTLGQVFVTIPYSYEGHPIFVRSGMLSNTPLRDQTWLEKQTNRAFDEPAVSQAAPLLGQKS